MDGIPQSRIAHSQAVETKENHSTTAPSSHGGEKPASSPIAVASQAVPRVAIDSMAADHIVESDFHTPDERGLDRKGVEQGVVSPKAALMRALRQDHYLASKLIRCIHGPTLDLSSVSVQAIEKLSVHAWAALAKAASVKISEIVFPPGLTALPEGIMKFGKLAAIRLPNFLGGTPAYLASIDGLGKLRLDLSDLTPRDITALSEKNGWQDLAKRLPGEVASITLPRELKFFPQGMENLGRLKEIAFPGFKGKDLHVPKKLGMLNVTGQSFSMKKLMVHRYSDDKHVVQTNLSGNWYYRRSEKAEHESESKAHTRTLITHFNAKATFTAPTQASGTAIVCRHLVVGWLRERYIYQDDKRLFSGDQLARFSYTNFASAEKISEQITADDEEVLDNIKFNSTRNYLVGLDRLSIFLMEQLKAMKIGDVRHFVVSSGGHAMALELQYKANESLKPQYVVNFYDPNRTVTHKRVTIGDPNQLAGENIANRLGVEIYFKGHVGDPMLMFHHIDPPMLDREYAVSHNPNRTLTIDVTRGEITTAPILGELMKWNFSKELVLQLDRLPDDHDQQIKILDARASNSDDNRILGGFGQACYLGCTETVRLMADVILNDTLALGLTDIEKFGLFASANEKGFTSMVGPFIHGRADIAGIMVRAVLDCTLPQPLKLMLLTGKLSAEPANLLAEPEPMVASYLEPFSHATEVQFSKESRLRLGELLGVTISDGPKESDAGVSTEIVI